MAKSKKKKIILISLVAVILVGLIGYAITQNKVKRVKVQVEKAEIGDITSAVTATGRVEARTDVKISADVMGRIIDLPVEEGQEIEVGDLLVQIDPASYRAEVSRSKAALVSAKATFEKARLAYNRNEQLYKRKLISKEELDLSKSDLDVVRGQVSQAEASLEQMQDQLSKTTIRSPIKGIVTALNSEKGENVVIGTMNNPGTVIMVISDLSTIEVRADVDETDIAMVKKNQDVKISLDAFPDTTYKGIVTEIGNSAQITGTSSQNQVVNFMVTALLQDDVEGIRPGMSATVDITTAECEDAVTIPIQAIVMHTPPDSNKTEGEETAEEGAIAGEKENPDAEGKSDEKKEPVEGVFVVKEGEAKFVPVKTGIADQQNIEIKDGVAEGDSIITGRYKTLRNLKDGDAVEPEKKSKNSD